jgi:capsular exopolysaccharide synthesis family protein
VTPRDPGTPEPAGKQPDKGQGHSRSDRRTAGRVPAAEAEAALAVRGGAPALPPALSSGPDFRTLLGALGRRWLLATILGGTLAAVAGVAAWCLLSAKYTAFAQLKIASITPYIVFHNANNPDGRNDFSLYQRTQAAALKNRYVLNAALKRDDVKQLSMVRTQAEPITWLEEELKIEVPEGSEIINVKLSGSEPAELVTLVNAVTQVYLQEVVNAERKQRSDRLAELDDYYSKAKEKVRIKTDTMRKRADEAGGSDRSALTQKQLTLLNTFGELKRQHAQVRFELMRAEGRLAAFKAHDGKVDNQPIPESALKAAVDADETMGSMRKSFLQVEDTIDRYVLAGAPRTDSSMITLQTRRETLLKKMDARLKELRPIVAERLRLLARDDYAAHLAQLQDEIAPLAAQEKTLQNEVKTLGAEADKIGTSSTEIEMLRAEIKQEEEVMERVGHELQALQVELRSPPRVSLYQEAGLQKKDNKRQLLATVMAPLVVLFGVCFCIAWMEFRARRIHSADEVVTGLGMRIVGTVPVLASSSGQALAGGDDGHTLLESIDAIRTVLLRDASVEATQVIMVTSAADGEGKTTLAGYLASSLARAGRRTLLLDCDLRRPACHQLFELPLQPGFSEVLLEEIDVEAAVLPTTVDDLWVIPAGQWDRAVVQALAREGVQKIFEQLKGEFDFIVLDSHPVMEATDALLIGQHADAVIFSLLRGVSQMPQVYGAGQQLTALGIRVLGAVINGMAPEDVYRHGAAARYAA